jgi:hypothetical protein
MVQNAAPSEAMWAAFVIVIGSTCFVIVTVWRCTLMRKTNHTSTAVLIQWFAISFSLSTDYESCEVCLPVNVFRSCAEPSQRLATQHVSIATVKEGFIRSVQLFKNSITISHADSRQLTYLICLNDITCCVPYFDRKNQHQCT